MRSTFIVDVLKVVIGLYISLVILYALLGIGKKLPNGLGGFFSGASKLATPSS